MKTPFYNWKIYLDTCCLSRPFNDQTQTRIRRETEAIQTLLKSCFTEQCFWITSDVLILEVNNTPNQIQRDYMRIQLNRAYQNISIGATENIRGQELEVLGFKWFDALHLACAESSQADVFLTTDDRLIRTSNRVRALLQVRVENPYTWLQEIRNAGDDEY
ncbi:MAG: PIN domain-containing protein [Candidatus Poribacteria bacterium]|nr:PIN domain-containing protein [Candidatus Poribacteria bacterium]